jgi:hypothetical protein
VPAEVLQRLAAAVSATLESGLDEEDLERLAGIPQRAVEPAPVSLPSLTTPVEATP